MIGGELHAVGTIGRWCCRMGSHNYWTETGEAQVGKLLRVVGGDSGTETGDSQVGG